MKPSTTTELEKLISFINDSYTGDYGVVSRDLYRTIHYLHYLEPGSVGVVELRNTCFILSGLAESFFEADRLRRKQDDQLSEELAMPLTADGLWLYRL